MKKSIDHDYLSYNTEKRSNDHYFDHLERKIMNKQHRFSRIAEICKEKGEVSVEELVKEIEVSPATIRRDLQDMEELKIITRYHGGAKFSSKQYDEPHMILKSETNVKEKQAIALKAASLIKDSQMVYLDAGSTTFEMIKYIHAKNITVVTPGIRHILELARKEIFTIVLGGPLRPETEAIAGRNTVEQIKEMYFDIAFIGTNGIHEKVGFTTSNEMEAATKNTAVKQSKIPFIVTDSSKFFLLNPVQFARLNDAIIISDSIPKEFLNLHVNYVLSSGKTNCQSLLK